MPSGAQRRGSQDLDSLSPAAKVQPLVPKPTPEQFVKTQAHERDGDIDTAVQKLAGAADGTGSNNIELKARHEEIDRIKAEICSLQEVTHLKP